MKNYRIFVEKRPGFRVEAESLQHDLNENLGLHLSQLRLLNVYDLFGFTPELLEASRYRVFGEVQTDEVTDACDLEGRKFLAVEYLPGQFDLRAASAVDCVRLIDPEAEVRIRSSRLPGRLVQDLAKREKFDLVLYEYFYASDRIDLTKRVIDLLDASSDARKK